MHAIKSRRFPLRSAVIYEGGGLKEQFQGTRSEARDGITRDTTFSR